MESFVNLLLKLCIFHVAARQLSQFRLLRHMPASSDAATSSLQLKQGKEQVISFFLMHINSSYQRKIEKLRNISGLICCFPSAYNPYVWYMHFT